MWSGARIGGRSGIRVSFTEENADRLVVLDEVHRVPELFPELHGIIDEGRRQSRGTGRFRILGSVSVPLRRQSESLAGRILYVQLGPLDLLETASSVSLPALWLRGGLPRSLLAESDADSLRIRRRLVETYLPRDLPHSRHDSPSKRWTGCGR